MSFDIGNIVGSINKAVLPSAIDATVPDTGSIEHEPVHAQLAGKPDSNPAGATAERYGIIVIGGHENPQPPPIKASADNELSRQGMIIIGGDSLQGGLHPVAAAAVAEVRGESSSTAAHKFWMNDLPYDPPATGSGISGLLHTVANLGRG